MTIQKSEGEIQYGNVMKMVDVEIRISTELNNEYLSLNDNSGITIAVPLDDIERAMKNAKDNRWR